MRRSELVHRIEAVPPFSAPRPELEQLVAPAEAAATLLDAAARIAGLKGTAVTDLGCGTGRLAIGAALLTGSAGSHANLSETTPGTLAAGGEKRPMG